MGFVVPIRVMTEASRITTAASIGMPAKSAGRVTAKNSVLRAITSRSSSTLRTPRDTGGSGVWGGAPLP